MGRAAKRSPGKLLDDDANLEVRADYNIDCEIVSLIPSLAKALREIIKSPQNFSFQDCPSNVWLGKFVSMFQWFQI